MPLELRRLCTAGETPLGETTRCPSLYLQRGLSAPTDGGVAEILTSEPNEH